MNTTTPRLTDELMQKAKANTLWAREHYPFVALAPEQTFAQKIKRAIKARQVVPRAVTKKDHEQYVERENARYRKPAQRQRTKGE